MNIARIRMIAKRVILQFRRDHRTLALLFVAPIFVITLLGIIVRESGSTITLAVVNEDTGPAGTVLVNALKSSDKLVAEEMTRGQAETALKEGRIKAAVMLEPNLSSNLMTARKLNLELVLEGSNPTDSMAVMSALSATSQKALAMANGPETNITTSYLYGGPQFDSLDLFAPAYIPFFVFFFVFLLTSVSFLRERAQGTMERLMATPAGRGEVVIGYTVGFGLFALIQALVVLLWSVYVLPIHYVGSLLLVFLIESVLTMIAVGLGIFLSIFARNELQAIQFIPIVIIPQALVSGILWPIKDLPGWLQPFAYVMPLTYGLRALRDVMIKGWGILEITPDLLVLVAFAIVTLLLGALSLSREIA